MLQRRAKTELYSGNCTDVLPCLESDSVHMVLTEPPYFLNGLDSEWKKGKPKTKRNRRGLADWHEVRPKAKQEFSTFH